MESLRDKNGKTEVEFLREYDVTEYFRPSVTVDAVIYRASADGLNILFIKRGGHPFIGDYAFPGGFVEKDESCEQAVCRELKEETGLDGIALRQLVTVSTPERDPRWRNITVVYCGAVKDIPHADAGDDAAAAEWFDVHAEGCGAFRLVSSTEEFSCRLDVVRDAFGNIDLNNTAILERGRLAFDHAKIVCFLIDRLKKGEL